ncbi:MAG: glycosyltransferase family 4 protein [Planctomycetota bacterium]|nr:glycosyltransferase family 4 protein [Planctomycetota bacterium]
MKLGVLLDRVKAPVGGAERHTLALLAQAAREEGAALLASLDCDSELVPPGVTLLTIDAPRSRPERDEAFAREGAKRLREAGADVVLAIRHALDCDVYFPHGGLVDDARAAKDRAAGGVSFWTRVARAFSRKHAFFQEAERALLGRPDGPTVIAVSHLLAARIASRYPASKERIRTVINGVDGEHFERSASARAGQDLRSRHVQGDALVLLLMAHHPVLKGVDTVIEALGRTEVADDIDRPVHLFVVGGPVPRKAWSRARSLGVASQVHALGQLDDPRVAYAAADVLVHPTWYDPCSLVCLEALAMELPVITTPRNGVRDVMGQRGGIVIEEPGNPEALAVAIRVLADPEMRAFSADDARYLAMKNRETTRLDRVLDICRNTLD